jgi:hypothetical protein
MGKNSGSITLELGRTAFDAGMYHFNKAYKLMEVFPHASLVVNVGELERVVLQQANSPDRQIALDRLSPSGKNDPVVLKIELDDELIECPVPNTGNTMIEDKTVVRSYIATNDSHGSVTELVEMNDRLYSRLLRSGEKRDLFHTIADASLCQVD